MTVEKGSAYPYATKPQTLALRSQDYHSLSADKLQGYGRYIEDINNPPPIEQLAYIDPDPRSFRPADPGTGINKAVIKGDFASYFNPSTQTIEACNLAVKSKGAENADYTIGWAHEGIDNCFRVVEFNNHKDAGQQFIIHQGEGALFLLGATPLGTDPSSQTPTQVHSDFIDPLIDLVVFYATVGSGFEVSPHVYHQPLYPLSQGEEVVALSIQGSIHNCTTCDFVSEMGFDVGLSLEKPNASNKRDFLSQVLSRYQWIVHCPYPNGANTLSNFSVDSRNQLLSQFAEQQSVNDKECTSTVMPLVEFSSLVDTLTNESEAQALLLTAIKERINWLEKAGRYLLTDGKPVLYDLDSFGLASLLSAVYPELTELTELKQSAAARLNPSLTPYQQVLSQIER